MSSLRFKPKEVKPLPPKIRPGMGRFKVIIKPILRDDNCEWWAKVDDRGEEVFHYAGYNKDDAERKARAHIRTIKTRENHEKQPGTEWEED